MITDIFWNKKLNLIVTELNIKGRRLTITIAMITQFYFALPKNIRLNYKHYLTRKFRKKRRVLQIAFNHPSDWLERLHESSKQWSAKPFSLVIVTAFASDNPSH